jgi:6-phosphogluconate dehydrogenase
MQLICEAYQILKQGLGLKAKELHQVFTEWNQGELDSYLIEITRDILGFNEKGKPIVEKILDAAGQKGTGKWTVLAAVEHGVPVPTIAAAVDARNQSAARDLRVRAEAALRPVRGPLPGVSVDDLRDALYAAKICSYTQGFALLGLASEQRGYGTDLAEVARIWTAGCIIRAVFLDRIRAAFAGAPAPELLALAPDFIADLARRLPGWRRVVAAAATTGRAIPGLAASLAWFDTLTTARGSAALIQAQRDYFGSHTYERSDGPGRFVHTDWPRRLPGPGAG